MFRHLLVLGTCLLALGLTATTASADGLVISSLADSTATGPGSLAGSSVTGLGPTNTISGAGFASINHFIFNGPPTSGPPSFINPEAAAFSTADFLLLEPHAFLFSGYVASGFEIGVAGASAGFTLGPPIFFAATGNDFVPFATAGILPPGVYTVLADATARGIPQLGGQAFGEYEFTLRLRPIPEPTSLALLASGVFALFLRRRRRR